MSTEENKAVIRSWIAELNKGNLNEAAPKFFAESHLSLDAPPGQRPGPEGVKERVSPLLAAFPDLHFTVEEMVAEEDRVATRFTVCGTHQGEYMGIPPTNRQVTIRWVSFARLVEGKIVASWSLLDGLALMRQLGVKLLDTDEHRETRILL